MIRPGMINAYGQCTVDMTGIIILLSFAAFFGVLAVVFELIDKRKRR